MPSSSPWVPALRAAGIGAVVVGGLGIDLLLQGGLAVAAALWTATLFLGVPLARAEWLDRRAKADEVAFFGFLTVVTVSAGLGELAWAGVLVWVLAALLGRFQSVLVVLSGLLVVAMMGASTAAAAKIGIAWEVYAPAFHTGTAWASTALALGVFAGWAPLAWSEAEAPHPGRSGSGWLSVGIVLAVVLGWLVLLGCGWLGSASLAWVLPLPLLVAASWTSRAHAWWPVAGAVATLYFFTPELRIFWWTTSLPLLLGAAAMVRAWRQRSALALTAGVVLLGACAACYRGLPADLVTAAASALPFVGAVWWVGSHR